MNRLRTLALVYVLLGLAGSVCAADGYGKLTGIVSDPAGNPQMGATVWLTAEAVGGRPPLQLLSDRNGAFTGQRLRPGLYSVKATLAGFLPTIEQHISVGANMTTLIRIELDSVFASLDTLRRPAAQPAEGDDWRWVLRTSAATRPVLQLRDGAVVLTSNASSNPDASKQPRALLEMTSGSAEPGSSSALAGSFATTASYDQSLGGAGRLLLAGRLLYPESSDDSLGGSIASMWVPSGDLASGPETTVVLRQIHLGPQQDTNTLRTMRMEHTERMMLTDRLAVEYGAEYVMGSIAGAMSSAIRPHARLGLHLSPAWNASFSLETNPDAEGLWTHTTDLQSAAGELDTLPMLVWHNGQPALEGGWHEEFAVRRKLGSHASLEGAAFHDYSGHQAVYGFSSDSPSPAGLFSTPWAHDAGSGGSWGTRVVYRERVSDHLEVAAVYTWAGALATDDNQPPSTDLSQIVSMRQHHSAAARVSGEVPGSKTEVTASYKWLDGTVVSRQDLFGEAALGIDPNLSLIIRQPLPSFLAVGRWEALVDFRNVFSQGYVSVDERGGRLVLMPVERSFRGGVSFQF